MTDHPDLIWRPTGERLVCLGTDHYALMLGDGTELVVWKVLPGRDGDPWLAQRYKKDGHGNRLQVLEAAKDYNDPQAALDALAARLQEQHAALGEVLGHGEWTCGSEGDDEDSYHLSRLTRERDEARAEVERLREAIDMLESQRRAQDTAIVATGAEVERLRARIREAAEEAKDRGRVQRDASFAASAYECDIAAGTLRDLLDGDGGEHA